MNLQDMTNQQLVYSLCNKLSNIDMHAFVSLHPELSEIETRLCAVKSPYLIRYKFLPNDIELEKCPEVAVRGTSPKNACQVLLDANFNWVGQDMVFAVIPIGHSWWTNKTFTSADLD